MNRWISIHEFRGKIVKNEEIYDGHGIKITKIHIEYEDTKDVVIINIKEFKEKNA